MTSPIDSDVIKFITDNTLEKRRAIAECLLSSYPDRVPVIITRSELNGDLRINKHKFVAPSDITFSKFLGEVRHHISGINSSTGLYFFLSNNILPQSSEFMSTLYDKYKSPDGFLYLTVSCESTFG